MSKIVEMRWKMQKTDERGKLLEKYFGKTGGVHDECLFIISTYLHIFYQR